jgi:itaconyl-CoA hydratase
LAGHYLGKKAFREDKRESKSRPTQGIVTVSTRGLNQDGVEVMSFERAMLIFKRGHSPDAAANYSLTRNPEERINRQRQSQTRDEF